MQPGCSSLKKDEKPGAWAAACNIGPNPTFGEQVRKVEAHLIGFRAISTDVRWNSTS